MRSQRFHPTGGGGAGGERRGAPPKPARVESFLDILDIEINKRQAELDALKTCKGRMIPN